MIGDTLRKLEEKVRDASGASTETREDLLDLLGELRTELEALGETHAEQALSIAGRAWAAANGSEEGDEKSAEGLVGELEETVKEFEISHPRLVGAVRSFFRLLGNAGI